MGPGRISGSGKGPPELVVGRRTRIGPLRVLASEDGIGLDGGKDGSGGYRQGMHVLFSRPLVLRLAGPYYRGLINGRTLLS